MNRNTAMGLYLLGLAFYAGYKLAEVHSATRERERMREADMEHRFGYVRQAIQDLHGRIDAEKWLAGAGELEPDGVMQAPAAPQSA